MAEVGCLILSQRHPLGPQPLQKALSSGTGSLGAVPQPGPSPGGQYRGGAAGLSKYHVPRHSDASPWPCLYPELLSAEWQVLGFKASVAVVQPVSPS